MSTVSSSGSRAGNVQSMVNRLSQYSASKPDVVLRKNPIEKRKIYEARFSYDAEHKDELTFDVGAKIEGIEDAEEGWMKGRLLSSGQIGMFPLNFVELIEQDDIKKDKMDEKITDQLTLKLKETLIKPSERRSNTEIQSLEKLKEKAKVLYKYEAEQSDEISLDVGNVVTVVRKKVADDGWIEVEHKGKIGIFPENFVKILPLEDKPIATAVVQQPPTPPPIKPKPSTPSTSVPPVLSQSTTGISSQSVDEKIGNGKNSRIRELQNRIFPRGATLPQPGNKPTLRPVTIIGNTDLSSDDNQEFIDINESTEKIPTHVIKDKPKQKQKRPPSMFKTTANEDNATSVPQTTSFPVKESPPSITTKQPLLITKELDKNIDKQPDKAVTKTITHEAIIVPKKKSGIIHSTGSISSSNSVNTTNEESDYVSRKEYNLLLQRIVQLEKQVKELINSKH